MAHCLANPDSLIDSSGDRGDWLSLQCHSHTITQQKVGCYNRAILTLTVPSSTRSKTVEEIMFDFCKLPVANCLLHFKLIMYEIYLMF